MFLFIIIPNFSFLPSRTVSKIKPASLKKNLKKKRKKIFFYPHIVHYTTPENRKS